MKIGEMPEETLQTLGETCRITLGNVGNRENKPMICINYVEPEKKLGGKIFLMGIFKTFGSHSLLKFSWAIFEQVLFYINSL